MNDAVGLRNHGRALEESFFERENQKLLAKLREQGERDRKRATLREALRIDDEDVLDHLVALDVSPETIVAFSLVPLVEVAWADGEIQPKERDAILKAAVERGVGHDSPTAHLLSNWLAMRPDPQLLETWMAYIEELKPSLSEASRKEMKKSVMGRARAIAEAAGGFLGVGSISAAEKKMLDELEWAFE